MKNESEEAVRLEGQTGGDAMDGGGFDPDAPASGDHVFGIAPREDALFSIIPVPWEATTSSGRGTRKGPERIFEGSLQVDLCDLDCGEAWKAGINWLEVNPEIATLADEAEADALRTIASAGRDLEAAARVNALSERLNEIVRKATAEELAMGKIPVIVGGDHSVPFGAMLAAAEAGCEFGVLHIDAHADLRTAYENFTWSHASIMQNVLDRIPAVERLVQVGIRDCGKAELERINNDGRIETFFDHELSEARFRGKTWNKTVSEIKKVLPKTVWISIDVDGMDPSLCPATGTPVPGGMSFRETVHLLKKVCKSRRVIGFDIVETGDASWDGNVSARLLYKLCGLAA